MIPHYTALGQMPPGRDSGVVEYEPIVSEMSSSPGEYDIRRDGGRDIDLANY